MNVRNIKITLLCLALCVLMSLSLVSCVEIADESTAPEDSKVEVVRVLENIDKGIKITTSKIEVVSVDKESLPPATILSKDEVLGKYATVDMIAGDYFTPVKITDKRPETPSADAPTEDDGVLNFKDAGYVIVSDYVKADTGTDVSDAIQKLIDENPNKTLYFPDGVYLISKPITTSADPSKSVSLELSNYAHFKPTEDWSSEEAMFRLGATDMAEGIVNEGNYYSLTGGIIDGNKIADAISVENAGIVSLRYISIKGAVVGIHVKGDEQGRGPRADIHTVNIVGSLTLDSIGVLIESNGNTLTNMRIASNLIAIKLTGSDNFLRNLHPLYIYEGGLNNSYAQSCAFYDVGTRNFYDNCYNDQFAVGFYMGKDTASIYDCCFNFWYSDRGAIHIAFKAEGKFNSNIRSTAFDTNHNATALCEFLVVGESGGAGVIESVFFNPNHVKDQSFRDYIINEPIY